MTTAKLIGADTARCRLIQWHKERIARAFPLMTEDEAKDKLIEATSDFYNAKTSRHICKEYDSTFSEPKEFGNDVECFGYR